MSFLDYSHNIYPAHIPWCFSEKGDGSQQQLDVYRLAIRAIGTATSETYNCRQFLGGAFARSPHQSSD